MAIGQMTLILINTSRVYLIVLGYYLDLFEFLELTYDGL
jgi:hypothetical protein